MEKETCSLRQETCRIRNIQRDDLRIKYGVRGAVIIFSGSSLATERPGSSTARQPRSQRLAAPWRAMLVLDPGVAPFPPSLFFLGRQVTKFHRGKGRRAQPTQREPPGHRRRRRITMRTTTSKAHHIKCDCAQGVHVRGRRHRVAAHHGLYTD